MTEQIKVFGEHETRVIDQLRRCVDQEDGSRGVLCADGHLGYSAPIGGVVAYREHVSPAAVGYDIGCGNLAVATNLRADDQFADALPGLMDRIYAEVSFGMGRRDGGITDHPVFDAIAHAEFEPQRALLTDARKQLGTVGAGNHYVNVMADETDRVWVGCHFGSRGFGHRTASGFLALAKGHGFHDRVPEGEMEAPPDVLSTSSDLGQAYIAAMRLAGEYAYAGRAVVTAQVLAILGAQPAGEPVHNHHNFAWLERHDDEDVWVVRKGATPAFPGQRGFVGATMGEPSVILEGVESGASADALYSTVHGAGRAMSRTAAAGKSRKRWACPNCAWVQTPGTHKPDDGRCPTCGHHRLAKRWVQERAGAIDWPATLADLHAKGIELRGANAEEAPLAYKRLDEVLAHHAGTVRVLHTLRPLGVAMASGDTVDAIKD